MSRPTLHSNVTVRRRSIRIFINDSIKEFKDKENNEDRSADYLLQKNISQGKIKESTATTLVTKHERGQDDIEDAPVLKKCKREIVDEYSTQNVESFHSLSKKKLSKNNACVLSKNKNVTIKFNSKEGTPFNFYQDIKCNKETNVHIKGDATKATEHHQTHITNFSIYDRQGQPIQIDSGVIENDEEIFMSGYLKSFGSGSTKTAEKSVLTKDIGPIVEWLFHETDDRKKSYISVKTEHCEYILMKPSIEYTSVMNIMYERIWLCKLVVEYLKEHYKMLLKYKKLIELIRDSRIHKYENDVISDEMLIRYAELLCKQVIPKNNDSTLITLPHLRCFLKLMGIKYSKKVFKPEFRAMKVDQKARNIKEKAPNKDDKALRKDQNARKIKVKAPNIKEKAPNIDEKDQKAYVKATTTPLVRKNFESFFTNQLDKINENFLATRTRCGICKACQFPDCGECKVCHTMKKFGGHGQKQNVCIKKACLNILVQHNDGDKENKKSNEKDEFYETPATIAQKWSEFKKIKWVGQVINIDKTRIYYGKVEIDGKEYSIGDYVTIKAELAHVPALIARIVYMWKETDKRMKSYGYFHAQMFVRGSETLLGEVSNLREIFLFDTCLHEVTLASIIGKAHIEKKNTPADWFRLGDQEMEYDLVEDDGKTYYYSKFYDGFTARFEDLPLDPECPNELRKHRFCPSCERKTQREVKIIPRVFKKFMTKSEVITNPCRTEWSVVKWRDYDYKKGCAVMLIPGTFNLIDNINNGITDGKPKLPKVDESIYTEYYRKLKNKSKCSKVQTKEERIRKKYLSTCNPYTKKPYCIGYVAAVGAKYFHTMVLPEDMFVVVHVIYRPENTRNKFPDREDLNVVYWSDETIEVPFSKVVGPCELVYDKVFPTQSSLREWLEKDDRRFYFRKAYDRTSKKLLNVPDHAKSVGDIYGKMKINSKVSENLEPNNTMICDINVRPLRTLDVFAGCGGLSAGLHQSGIADCKWAIENSEAAALAYKLNNKNCIVFNEDCNELLKDVLSGTTHSREGFKLPLQGEVELLCGGPPCQGFSGMNRFNSGEYSNFKNSLIASLLSYCDYYRPKYFILENVRNFVAYKRGMVLKLTMKALLDMGYQCTFGVVQAGDYGVPQTRRRLIILASAPGYSLPLYPKPTHAFRREINRLTVRVDNESYDTNIEWALSAPKRTVTIGDAISDLPEILTGANETEIEYGSQPQTHFQCLMRSDNMKVRDHICSKVSPLAQARISRIPTTPGADWRNLPNIAVTLSDGTDCEVLRYKYVDKKCGSSALGKLRGVCACATGAPCNREDNQNNTLIPWCLPHTAHKNNNWNGIYGRLCWDGYFSTTVTMPEPMGKQGRVLHPAQHRVVSVREWARSQGFPDTYMFAGTIKDKYRQIGNAVPPPLGAALGREIKKSFILSTSPRKPALPEVMFHHMF